MHIELVVNNILLYVVLLCAQYLTHMVVVVINMLVNHLQLNEVHHLEEKWAALLQNELGGSS
jgi:hypothetical protein